MDQRITCLLCAYEEEETISRACQSLVEQSIDFDEFILIDSRSQDQTVDIASSYVDEVIQAPKGKLSARNYAIHPPADAEWNGPSNHILLNVDADKYYPPNWAEILTQHFKHPDVVGVSGETRYEDSGEKNIESMIADFVEVAGRGTIKYLFSEGYTLEGGNSALRKDAFKRVGGFDTSWVDQTEIWQVWHEEEFYFAHRLSKVGTLVLETDAVAYEPPRRWYATFGETDYSQKIDRGMRM